MSDDWKIQFFGPELVTKDGKKPTLEVLANKKYVGIYFSAHWCPPCRGFTPVLSEFYESFNSEKEDSLEIVFASSDSDQSSFDEYYGSMPWKAIPFGGAKKDELATKYGIRGIPSFIVVSGSDGSTKDANGRATVSGAAGNFDKAANAWA